MSSPPDHRRGQAPGDPQWVLERRRPRDGGGDLLPERDWELAALSQCLEVARGGVGAMIVLDASPGMGKSRLLIAAGDMAREAGMTILAGTGIPLERDYPFGLATQLFEPLWLTAAPDERRELLSGPAELAASLFGTEPLDDSAERYPVVHGLFWTLRNLISLRSAGEAIAVIVDDAHYADAVSLRFLAYLAERAADLPIALILATRSGERSSEPQALSALIAAAKGRILSPAPLTAGGIDEVVRSQLPDAAAPFVAACGWLTGGNPFLLHELVRAAARHELAPDAAGAAWLDELMPETVLASVSQRLSELPDAERALLRALAVLGRGATVPEITTLSGLETDTVLAAADALAERQLIGRSVPLHYRQPLITAAVLRTMAPLQRAQAHLAAARMLADRQGDPEEIADHLLRSPADDNPAAIATLRAAAQAASQRGDRARSIALLQRALDESQASRSRSEIAAALSLERGLHLSAQGRSAEAADTLSLALQTAGTRADPTVTERLRSAHVAAAALAPGRSAEALAARDTLIAETGAKLTPLARSALAHTLVLDALNQAPREQIDNLAERAWGDGELLQTHVDAPFAPAMLAAGLIIADRLERAVAILDVGLPETPQTLGGAAVLVVRAWALYEQGALDAADEAAAKVSGRSRHCDVLAQAALCLEALCALERGDLDAAASRLERVAAHAAPDSLTLAAMHHVRSQLRLAQHEPVQSLEDARAAGALLEARFPGASPGALPWRSAAALAHLALGEPDPARALARKELAAAERTGAARTIHRALRVLGLALNGKGGGIRMLARAKTMGRGEPVRLEYIRALIDYGAALRRANRRADARDPLRQGLDLSHRGGMTQLAARAQIELVATGARPRRAEVTGVNSLTASQLRVAELAARGLTTRQISEALFVTPKTVEFHLRQTYRKLDVTSRDELAELLGAGV